MLVKFLRCVILYSEPYLNSKFGGYYAAWSDYSIQQIIGNLFIGKTLGESYGDIKTMGGVTPITHTKSAGNTIYLTQLAVLESSPSLPPAHMSDTQC